MKVVASSFCSPGIIGPHARRARITCLVRNSCTENLFFTLVDVSSTLQPTVLCLKFDNSIPMHFASESEVRSLPALKTFYLARICRARFTILACRERERERERERVRQRQRENRAASGSRLTPCSHLATFLGDLSIKTRRAGAARWMGVADPVTLAVIGPPSKIAGEMSATKCRQL